MPRLTRAWKAILLVAVGAVAGGAAFAVASVPDSSGLIHVCYAITKPVNGDQPVPNVAEPNVIVIDPSAGQSCSDLRGGASDWQALTIDQTGIQGPAGPSGTPGTQGTAGLPGLTGAQGIAGPQIALPTTNSAIVGQVTLKPPHQGTVGSKAPAGISFDALSVTLNGKSSHGSLTVVKLLDTSSPQLLQGLTTDSVFPTGTILLDGPNSKSDTHYTLAGVVIKESKLTGAGGAKTQTLTLAYQKIEIQK
ncbi:MAG TPA: type VI secretion system tube protein Hcp [Solirubrobacteraceae bacterium]